MSSDSVNRESRHTNAKLYFYCIKSECLRRRSYCVKSQINKQTIQRKNPSNINNKCFSVLWEICTVGNILLIPPSVCLHVPDHIACICVCMLYVSLLVWESLPQSDPWLSVHRPNHSVRPPDAEATHSCLRSVLLPWGSHRGHAYYTHTITYSPEQADQEETRFQGHEKKAWMENGILSHVATFRSRSWQACFGSSCFLDVSLMATGLELISDPPWGKGSENDWPSNYSGISQKKYLYA